MSIRRKLFLSFFVLTLFLLAQFAVNFHFDQEEQNLVNSMLQEHQVSTQLSALAIAAQKVRRYEKEYFIYIESQPRRERYYQEFAAAREKISRLLKSLKQTYKQLGKQNMESQVAVWELATLTYANTMDSIHQAVEDGKIIKVIDANNAIKSGKNRFRIVSEGTQQAIDDAYHLSLSKADRISQIDQNAMMASILLVALSVMIGLVIAMVIPQSIVRPLRELSEAVNRISKGRINEPVDVAGSEEIVNLSSSLQQLQNVTFNLIKRIQNARTEAS